MLKKETKQQNNYENKNVAKKSSTLRSLWLSHQKVPFPEVGRNAPVWKDKLDQGPG